MSDLLFAGAFYTFGVLFIINSLFYLWRLKELRAALFSGTLLLFGLTALIEGLFYSGGIVYVPLLYGFDFVVASFLVPTMAFFFRGLYDLGLKWKKVYWLIYLYPVFQLVTFGVYVFARPDYHLGIVHQALEEGQAAFFFHPISFYIHGTGLVVAYAYGIWNFLVKFQWNLVPAKDRLKVAFGTIVSLSWGFIGAWYCIAYLLSSRQVVAWGGIDYMIFYTLTYSFFLFLQFWPYYFKYGIVYFDLKTFKIEKDGLLTSDGIYGLEEKLEKLFFEKEVYKNYDLNMEKVAKKLGVTRHLLSAFLNQCMNQSFFDYLNCQRVVAAKAILLENPDENIMGVCYQVGFNSPSAFYKAFKKNTGYAPKEWLKMERALEKATK